MIPRAAPSALPLYLLGAVLVLTSFILFYNVDEFWSSNLWKGLSIFVFAIIVFIGGVLSLQSAYKASQKFASDMKSTEEAYSSAVGIERSQAMRETARDDVLSEAFVRKMQRELEALRIQVEKRMLPIEEQSRVLRSLVEQREMQLRASFVEPARQQGMSVDQYMAVNEQWSRQLIDVEIRFREMNRILQGAVELQAAPLRLQQLKNKFVKELGLERNEISKSNLPPEVKGPLLRRYLHQLMSLERDEIHELHERARLVSASNREESPRHRATNTHSRTDYPSGVGDDEN